MKKQNEKSKRVTGMGQLSIVEHALCPLDSRTSLKENLVHAAKHSFVNKSGQRGYAKARVFCPLGLSAADELYLWGLLALSLLPAEPESELVATPHWILRQLGIINQGSKRGGRQYKAFGEALRRLSVVNYMSDNFYDPNRSEHRRVSFSFFSYSLPQDARSSRAWRIAWDPIFFEIVKSSAGHFRFDLAVYRELDAASRRLFLFVSKVLSRRTHLRAIGLEQLATDLLGFSPTLAPREMKAKVKRCLKRLMDLHVLADAEVFKTNCGNQFVRLHRGPYFQMAKQGSYRHSPVDSPTLDTLREIGFEDGPAIRMIQRFSPRLLNEWCDITQAAIERHGMSFFHKSPMAFLVDSLDKASKGNRTPPDWWADLKRKEAKLHEMTPQSNEVFQKVRAEIFRDQVTSKIQDSSPTSVSSASDILRSVG
ncbi:hypothetical protein [Rubripirellula reticaptiva]|uniref:Replication initiator protein A n=1 Tax=Rubripirellula reticaptiva TaxID=2528013 RepID=A0A5C6F5W0_9BACT|nr:hypothetical protein [Rubripirellula reticaptiva]TWU55940.1 hypothetical protein Poly59_22430 [Rubripirellula reticaptiva]